MPREAALAARSSYRGIASASFTARQWRRLHNLVGGFYLSRNTLCAAGNIRETYIFARPSPALSGLLRQHADDAFGGNAFALLG